MTKTCAVSLKVPFWTERGRDGWENDGDRASIHSEEKTLREEETLLVAVLISRSSQ